MGKGKALPKLFIIYYSLFISKSKDLLCTLKTEQSASKEKMVIN